MRRFIPGLKLKNKHDPRSHTKQHEMDALIRVISCNFLAPHAGCPHGDPAWIALMLLLDVLPLFQMSARTLAFPNSSGSAEFVQLKSGIRLR